MITLKCKMCGGALELEENTTVAECEYCGTRQTLPKLDDEKKTALFDRANMCRSRNEFDKAAVIYENILNDVADEAEAYWGLCLCRYGIEYVVDPKTQKRVPTCHRAQFKSILEDQDYLAAIEHADLMAKDIYKAEAEYIDKVQKDILAISSKEKPFDIFICYKETDNSGERTIDSVLAQDIYTELTEKGYKVFFSRITLEDKLGTAYEPYIFAALNSAKIMLVVGTQKEYFNAVWVRNEWSRYLSLIEQGQKKTIIPCYKDIDAYDLPEEFIALQGQDMGKIGAMQDLVRGIDKIIGKKLEVSEHSVDIKNNSNEIALPDGGLYVGESLAGKPHGKGKCIYKSGDNYVGEWAFGEFEGEGTYTYANGDYYTGSFNSSKKNGQGTYHWSEGGTWTGEWKDDKYWNGNGKHIFEQGYYEGEWVEGKRNGNGEFYWNDGGSWSGDWKDDCYWSGSGKHIYINSVHEGVWVNGKRNGKGIIHWNDGGSWTGEFKDDFFWTGNGKVVYDNGSFEGNVKEGSLTGNGIYHWNDGSYYEGDFENNKRNGQGTYHWSGGGSWTGEWKDDYYWNGNGKHIYNDSVYEGAWVNGKRNGYGVLYWNNGEKWTGEFKDDFFWTGSGLCYYDNSRYYYIGELKEGKRHGDGTYYYHDGTLKYSGQWKDDKFWSGKTDISYGYYSRGKYMDSRFNFFENHGCYIATCVYGSYDCPQVWTLRRFRDYHLSKYWFGRLFIKTYYSISPTVVRIFGNQNWFKSFWKYILDRWIYNLNREGVDNTPYQDKKWID